MAVAISSIAEQTEHNVDFHVLDYGITKSTKIHLLNDISKYSHVKLSFHPIAEELLQGFPNPEHFSLAMYTRFYIAEIAPHIDKAIYIDADTCVFGDIATMFAYDLEGYGLGAVSCDIDNIYLPYYPFLEEHKRTIGLDKNDSYFTSGLLIIDCTYWRLHSIQKQCFETLQHSMDIIRYPDQDILNIVFRSNYKKLPYYFHYFTHEISEKYTIYIAEYMKYPYCMLIHYCSQKKPWNTPDSKIAYDYIWWKYAKLTSFYLEFTTELLALQVKKILHFHKTAFHKKAIIYLKYKTSWGKRRKKYKKKYFAMKSFHLMISFLTLYHFIYII